MRWYEQYLSQLKRDMVSVKQDLDVLDAHYKQKGLHPRSYDWYMRYKEHGEYPLGWTSGTVERWWLDERNYFELDDYYDTLLDMIDDAKRDYGDIDPAINVKVFWDNIILDETD